MSLMLFWLLFSFTIEVKKSISKKCHFINVVYIKSFTLSTLVSCENGIGEGLMGV